MGSVTIQNPAYEQKKPLLRALHGEALASPPLWMMRQAGRYLPEFREVRREAGGFLNLCYDPERATEVTLQPIRRFSFDAAIVFADILLICQALGQHLEFRDGVGPILQPISSVSDLNPFTPEHLHAHMAPIYTTLRYLRGEIAKIAPKTALIGFAGAPWTVASYMIEGKTSRDHGAARCFAYATPERFRALIDLLIVATAEYLNGQIAAGAEVVQIFDSWAGSLAANQCERWCIEPICAIAARVKAAHPNTPIIAFPRGAMTAARSLARESHIDAVAIDPSIAVGWAATAIQPHAAVQGNLDPMALVAGGDALTANVRQIREALQEGAFIFNLGHGITPETPLDHVSQLVDLVRAPL